MLSSKTSVVEWRHFLWLMPSEGAKELERERIFWRGGGGESLVEGNAAEHRECGEVRDARLMTKGAPPVWLLCDDEEKRESSGPFSPIGHRTRSLARPGDPPTHNAFYNQTRQHPFYRTSSLELPLLAFFLWLRKKFFYFVK